MNLPPPPPLALPFFALKRARNASDTRATGDEASGAVGGFPPSRLSLRANFYRARDV